jgi:hypothetical protein
MGRKSLAGHVLLVVSADHREPIARRADSTSFECMSAHGKGLSFSATASKSEAKPPQEVRMGEKCTRVN